MHGEIPWRGLTGFRDVLVHEYEAVDLGEVWRMIEDELPTLEQALLAHLPPLEQLEAELAGEVPSEEE